MKKRLTATFLIAALCLSLCLPIACKSTAGNAVPTTVKTAAPTATMVPTVTATPAVTATPTPTGTQNTDGKMTVSFLDVGEADCVLIQMPSGKVMLIDAGNVATQTNVSDYLTGKGIQKIDALVATNPDSEHIGGMAYIIDHFAIGSAYMPKTSRSYGSLATSLKNKSIGITYIKAGSAIALDSALSVGVVAPVGTDYVSIDDYSAVLKLTYQSTSFLFAGDIRSVSEQEILAAGTNIKATVLKVSCHGSANASSAEFLSAVAPKYAVISVGTPNDYEYPGKTTLSRLKSAGAKVYRTDLNGTITFTSDGSKITIMTSR